MGLKRERPERENSGISGILTALAEGCTEQEDVNISTCRNITQECIILVSSAFESLVSLGLSKCGQTSDTGLKGLCHGHQNLQLIDLSLCFTIGNEGVIHFLEDLLF